VPRLGARHDRAHHPGRADLITGYEVHLGLDEVQTVLLILTLFVSGLTFGGVRTNVLQGTVHILLFIVYVALSVSPEASAFLAHRVVAVGIALADPAVAAMEQRLGALFPRD
jgi:hypothetical protein